MAEQAGAGQQGGTWDTAYYTVNNNNANNEEINSRRAVAKLLQRGIKISAIIQLSLSGYGVEAAVDSNGDMPSVR